ncbi:MAG: YIP1 family protein [Gemmatimonadaceae bacterium]
MSASLPYATDPVPAAREPQASVWEDLVDIWYAPSSVFRRRENGNYGIALVFVVALVGLLTFVAFRLLATPISLDATRAMERVIKAHPEFSADVVTAIRARASGSGSSPITPIFISVVVLLTPFLAGVVMWLVGKLFGSVQTLKSAFMVGTFAMFPKIIGALGVLLQALLLDTTAMDSMTRVSLGVARFIDPMTASPAVGGLALRADIVNLWSTVLIAIGLKVTGKLSTVQASIAAIIVFLVGYLPLVPSMM